MAQAHFERLSAMDLSFLAMEDGRAHMHIGSVSHLRRRDPCGVTTGASTSSGSYPSSRRSCHKFPRLRQRLEWVPGFAQPGWVDDERFNLRFHVRHTALPPPGDVRQLKRLARAGSCPRSSTGPSRCGSTGSSTASPATGSR